MESTEETYKTVLSDLNSSNTQSENVCSFFSDFLLNCLSKPVNLSLFSDEDRLKLEQKKKEVDAEISKELKIVNYEINGSVCSVFDNTDIYDGVLSRISGFNKSRNPESKLINDSAEKNAGCSGGKSAIALGINKVDVEEKEKDGQTSAEVNSTDNEAKDEDCVNAVSENGLSCAEKFQSLPEAELGDSKLSDEKKGSTKVYDRECSLKTGHIDLDLNLIRRSRRFQKYSSSTKSCLLKYADCSLEPIDKPPLTPSSFKIINLNLFINLSFYCGFCKWKINELYCLMGNEKALRSDLTLGFKDSLFRPVVKKKVTKKNIANKDEGMCIRIDDVFSTQIEDTSESMDNNVLDLSVCKAKDSSDKESEPNKAIKVKEKSNRAKENEELLLDVLDLNSLEEESPLIIFEDPKLLEVEDDEIIDKLTEECVSPVDIPLMKTSDKPPSNEKNKENTTSPIKTSQQILEEIYYKHKDVVNTGLIKKKSLKEKLDNMIQTDKTETKHIKRKVICGASNKKPQRKDISKSKPVFVNNSAKRKRSEMNPILPPPPSNEVKRVKNNIIKTVCVDKDSTKIVNEYVPLVVFDEKEAHVDLKKRQVHLNHKKRNNIKKLAKMLKREKRKQKLLKRAQINLSPPPGVDLDEYLLLQVEEIKQKLKVEEGVEKDKLEVPDIIKGQIHADGAQSSSHRKVVKYSAPELEQGEVLDSSDENHVNMSNSHKTPDTSSHSYLTEMSDDENISKPKANRSLAPSRTSEDRSKWIKSLSKSPESYSKTRFRSRSRSPVSKYRRNSSLRERRGSPSKRHYSPNNKFRSYDRNRSRTPEKHRFTDRRYRSRSPHKSYHSKSPEKRRYSKSPERRPDRNKYLCHKSNHESKYRSRTPDRSKNHRDYKRSEYYKTSCVRSDNYSRNRSPEPNHSSKCRSNEYRPTSPKRKAILSNNSYSHRKEAAHSKRHDYYASPRRSRYSRSPEGHSSRNTRNSPPRSCHKPERIVKDNYSPVSIGSFSPAEVHPVSPHSETEIIETTTTTVVQEEVVTIEL